jgi:origin recognition complex subunit 4
MHSNAAHLCVVGLTSKLDAVELLEKRVKSRFSGNQLLLPLPTSLDALCSILEERMCSFTVEDVRAANASGRPLVESGAVPTPVSEQQGVHESGGGGSRTVSSNANLEEYVAHFKRDCVAFLKSRSFRQAIGQKFQLGQNLRWFLTLMATAISGIDKESPFLAGQHVVDALRFLSPDDREEGIVADLTNLEVLLLIAATKMEEKAAMEFNFDSLFREYKEGYNAQHISTAMDNVETSYTEGIALKAFEHLLELRVFREVNSSIAPRAYNSTYSASYNSSVVKQAGGSASLAPGRGGRNLPIRKECSLVQLDISPDIVKQVISRIPTISTGAKTWARSACVAV